MKENNKVKRIVLTAVLTALVIALQLLSNYIQIGTISITLSLVPIVVGAILLGPLYGFFLGMVNGVIVAISPSTALFLNYNVVLTVVICMLKTGIAGLFSGLIYKLLHNKTPKLAVVLASIIVPITNTGIFALSIPIFYKQFLIDFCPSGTSYFIYILVGIIGVNFIIEFLLNSVLSPAIIYLTNIYKTKYNR